MARNKKPRAPRSSPESEKPSVVITAGATMEPIDPVRFITNHSSGKMAVCLLSEALKRRLPAVVIHGLMSVPLPRGRFTSVYAPTARDMLTQLKRYVRKDSIVLMAAAVADFRPARYSPKKIKRTADGLTLRLVPNPDIIRTIVRTNRPAFTVAFAAETSDMLRKGGLKLRKKNADLVVANEVGKPGIGFGSDHSRAAFLHRDGQVRTLGRISKRALAGLIFDNLPIPKGNPR
jgi:phosphopantothenoylcysteine decarboxylase/phosphopantothenate--cysteine ligase